MNRVAQIQERQLTLAEVCEALASGKLPAKVENGNYHIRRSDLRSLVRQNDGGQPSQARRPRSLAS